MSRIAGFAAFMAAAALVHFTADAAPRDRFSGIWNVSVWTDEGPCDRGYHYDVRIEHGQVIHPGGRWFELSGRVESSGKIRVKLRWATFNATGTGRLYRDYGSGTWSGASRIMACSGTWEAERLGR